MPDKARWGLLSTARINRKIIPAIEASQRGELIAVASRDPERAERYAETWGIHSHFSSYDELVHAPDIDVLYIPLPNAQHTEWVVKALDAGKHVLCEKPMCISSEGFREIRDAVDRSGKVVAEAFMYLHHPQTALFKEIVDSGRIGELRSMQSRFSYSWSREEDNYRLVESDGGGALWDVGVYPVSFFQYLADGPAKACQGFGSPSPIDLHFSGLLHYDNGITGSFYCSFDASSSQFTTIQGTQSNLYITNPYNYPEKCRAWIVTDVEFEELELPVQSLYVPEIDDMNAVVLDGTSPRISIDQSHGHLNTILQLRKSAGY